MKKTLSINLNGRAFNIDEDAYDLLDNYLKNLKLYFSKDADSEEIMKDFEARIEELFSERIRLGYNVISIEQVESVITRMGKPEDFGDPEFNAENQETHNTPKEEKPKKRFYRNVDDRFIGGVCSGIAAYFGWDPLPVRVLFVVLVFVSHLYLLIPYIILWILMPAAITAGQKLEMRGEAITLENIGKTVSETSASANKSNNSGCLGSFLKIFMAGIGCLLAFPLLLALFIVIVVCVSLLFGLGGAMFFPFSFFGFNWDIANMGNPIIPGIALIALLGIPLYAIIHSWLSNSGKAKPFSMTAKWIQIIIWCVALGVLIYNGVKIEKNLDKINFNNWTVSSGNGIDISESGNIIDRTEELSIFDQLKIENNLIANIRVRVDKDKTPQILMNGDENIVNHIKWKQNGNELKLYYEKGFKLNQRNNLIVVITVPDVSSIRMESIGQLTIDNKIERSDFKVKLEGAGTIQADSIYVKNLNCEMEGVGKINISGKTNRSYLKLEGTGKINASNLTSDSLTVRLNGVGSISCDPVEYMKASVEGIGKVKYMNEPKKKDVTINGMGKVSKE